MYSNSVGPTFATFIVGDLVLGKFTDGCWYRARVLAVIRNTATNEVAGADLLYFDYGNKDRTPVDR